MNYLVLEMLEMVGAEAPELNTFPELIVWFVTVIVAVSFLLFIIDGVFYAIKSVTKGMR